jgi:predicted nucleotidyltransferase component of viral defense system
MLQTSTIETETLSLLKRLMELPFLNNFHLVGGTALALKYGHRLSIDLDLFGGNEYDKESIATSLFNEFGASFVNTGSKAQWGLFCYINDVKVDIIHYTQPLLLPIETTSGIRMYHEYDILAMKVNAILGRGKKKDFWDLAELLNHYSIQDCIDAYTNKYLSQQLVISIPNALTYFEDAEESEDPISLKGQTWESIKKSIQQKVNAFLK